MPNQDLPISGLPVASSLDGSELFVVVQDGVTKYTTAQTVLYSPGSVYGLFNQTGDSSPVSGSTHGQGSLIGSGVGVLSVPANGFVKGDAFEVLMAGFLNVGTNGHTLQVQIKSDLVVLADTGVQTMQKVTAKQWRMDLNFSINEVGAAGVAEITTAGNLHYRTDSAGDVQGEIFSSTNNTTFDTTISNTLDVVAIWGSPTSDDDSIYTKILTLKKVY